MSRIFIHGTGAVSPAGWSAELLHEAVKRGEPLPAQAVARPGWEKPLRVRTVPAPAARPAFFTHPRLRRSGVMSQHTVAAALEALGDDLPRVQSGELRPGVIVCMMAGGVTYSRRFYEEVLCAPETASPLIFPETVFNAPASHLAAFLGSKGINYTLVGDEGTFLQSLALAADWLAADRTDSCLVVGTEEVDWIVADALRLFQPKAIYSGGAGALYLKKDAVSEVELGAITDSFIFTERQKRAVAASQMRSQLPAGSTNELLVDGSSHLPVWNDWPGRRYAPKDILGEAFVATAGWQCVLACNALQQKEFAASNVSIVGANQQAIGARFVANHL
jgi:hypothetical protein